MNWTIETPTEDGIYWHSIRPGDRVGCGATAVEVCGFSVELCGPDDVVVFSLGEGDGERLDECVGMWWYGPIQPPPMDVGD